MKIGYTDDENYNRRFRDYKLHNPKGIVVKTVKGGTEEQEKRLHYKFREHHWEEYGREWFEFDEKIIEFFEECTIEDLEKLDSVPEPPITLKKELLIYYKQLPETLEDGPIKDFFVEYIKLTTYVGKIHKIVDFILANPSLESLVINNLVDSDKIKQQLITVGASQIRGLRYNLTRINRAMGITIFDKGSFLEEIYSNFDIGQRYTKKYIKDKIGEIYKKADYKGTPKANDLEEWFNIKEVRIQVGSDRQAGFEIISKK